MIIFESILSTFEATVVSFFENAGAVVEIGSSLRSNHHNKFYLAQSRDTHFRTWMIITKWVTIAQCSILPYFDLNKTEAFHIWENKKCDNKKKDKNRTAFFTTTW